MSGFCREDIEDAVHALQFAFIKFHELRQCLVIHHSLYSWLLQVTKNRLLNQVKQLTHQEAEDISEADSAASSNIEEEIITRISISCARKKLSESDQQLIEWSCDQQFTSKEITEFLLSKHPDISLNTVNQRIQRAKYRLAKILEEDEIVVC